MCGWGENVKCVFILCWLHIGLILWMSVQFSCSVMSYSLGPHGLQHARLLCLSPTPGAWSDSCPSSRWCHPTILSSVVPFSHLQSFAALGSFSSESVLTIRWPKYWSFSFSISPSNEYSGLISLRIDWFDLLAFQGLSRVFSNTAVQKHQFFWRSAFFMVQLSNPYMITGKNIALINCMGLCQQSNVSAF